LPDSSQFFKRRLKTHSILSKMLHTAPTLAYSPFNAFPLGSVFAFAISSVRAKSPKGKAFKKENRRGKIAPEESSKE
jgi:hypothetical protein